MNQSNRKWLIVIGLICLIYAALRFWNLTASCLWFDEIFSVHAASLDWRNLLWFVAQDLIHPPLFYVLLKIWTAAGGESLVWLRIFPVFFSLLAVFPFILLCRELRLPPSTIALALAFFAVNGSLIKYAQEIRMYSLLLFFALVSYWLFARFLNSGKGFVFLLIVNVLLVYTHYYGWFVVFSEAIAVAVLSREKLKPVLLMVGAVFVGFAPWIYALTQAAKINADVGQNIGWMAKPSLRAILQFVYDLFEPVYFQQSNIDSRAILLLSLPIIVLGIIAFVFWLANLKNESREDRRNLILLAIFTATPLVLAFVVSWISPYSIWGTRHLIIVFAPFAILLAAAFSKINLPQIRLPALGLIFLLSAAAFVLQARQPQPVFIWCAWENLALGLRAEKPAKIYVFEDLVAYHFWFALRDSDAGFEVVKINGIEGLAEDKAYFLPRGFDEVKTAGESAFTGERFFVAFRDKNPDETKPPLKNLIEKGYKIGEPRVFEAQGLKAFLVEIRK
ncbi:MAG: glycosyltransferase family 39 protein [Acidobacteriota bacterium]|nr:glycosyltransferase family 39 protein [Acidobacteriota bacterium]